MRLQEECDEENVASESRTTDRPISRRKTLVAVGSGVVAAVTGPSTVHASTPTTEAVPAFREGTSVVETVDLPRQWLTHRKRVYGAKRQLLDRVGDVPAVFSVGLVGQSETYGDRRGLALRVQVTEKSGESRIPDAVDGVPVRVEAAPNAHGPGGCYNSSGEERAAGGDAVGWEGNGYGTATAAVHNEDRGVTQLLHCAHVFYEDCTDAKQNDLVGRSVTRGAGDSEKVRIGTIASWDRTGDYVLIDSDDDSEFLPYIEGESTRPRIKGHVSPEKIDALASGNEDATVKKMGVTTGMTTGTILSSGLSFTMPDVCYNYRGAGVESSTNFADGDSGGPVFLTRNGDEDAYLTHIASYRYWDRAGIETCVGNTVQRGNAVGTAGYHIANTEPISFG